MADSKNFIPLDFTTLEEAEMQAAAVRFYQQMSSDVRCVIFLRNRFQMVVENAIPLPAPHQVAPTCNPGISL